MYRQDVLLGRGQRIRNNPGNVAFRTLVDGRKAEFKKAKRGAKRKIGVEIIQQLQKNGRFLMEDASCAIKARGDDIERRTWIIADDDKVLVKTMHRLREKEYTPKTSSSCSDPVDEVKEVVTKAITEQNNDGPKPDLPDETTPVKSVRIYEPTIEEDLDTSEVKASLLRAETADLDLSSDLDELGSVCDGELVRDLEEAVHGEGSRQSLISNAPTNFPARDDHKARNNLRHWVDSHMPQGLHTCGELNEYIKAAIPIAIKLTQMLVDETHTGPAIELTSCNDLSIEFSDGEVIGITALKTSQYFGTLDRLASLGAIFSELFSGCVLPSSNTEAAAGCLEELALGADADREMGMLNDDHAWPYTSRQYPASTAGANTQFSKDGTTCSKARCTSNPPSPSSPSLQTICTRSPNAGYL